MTDSPPDEATAEDGDEPVSTLVIDDAAAGTRIDAFLAAKFPRISRGQFRRAINSGAVRVAGRITKASYRLSVGDVVVVQAPPPTADRPEPEAIPLSILYEDDHMAVVDKPAGMVVHPGKGRWSGTLVAALQYHFDELSGVGGPARPGVVHRLDRDTTGVIVIAKHDEAHFALGRAFHDRLVEKEYAAIAVGAWDRDADRVDQPIGPHPYHREKMCIRSDDPRSRSAETLFHVEDRFPGFLLIRAEPKTGRTHQIRVHLAHVGCPVLCDRLYGGRAQITAGELSGGAPGGEIVLARQALHARRIALPHPATGERLEVSAPLPEDMARAMELLRERRG